MMHLYNFSLKIISYAVLTIMLTIPDCKYSYRYGQLPKSKHNT